MTTSESERTVVHLMRHGEDHHPQGVLYGRLPSYQLSDLRLEMARTVAGRLADHDLVRALAPPLEGDKPSHHRRPRESSPPSPTSLDHDGDRDGDTLLSTTDSVPATGLLQSVRNQARA